jgi:glycosyltransferase involved in cell wall biosynthesis
LENKKIKVLTISDLPFAPSGVGTQTRYIIEHLLKTGKFKFFSLGGAMKHHSYQPVKTEEHGDDWVTLPVDGYGNQDLMRSIVRQERPDIVWFMTDPRFWGWLWAMENEIRPLCPMVYYHVWDNKPYPLYNKASYESNDFIATISKVTDDVVKNVAPDVKSLYIPHAVNSEVFAKHDKEDVLQFCKQSFGNKYDENKFIIFWNNRNARRKQSGSLIFWFKDFLDKVGHDKATLIMHTDTKDVHGQDLDRIVEELGLTNGEVLFSRAKVEPGILSSMYNMSDCTINVADAEGFGLATLESLSCETPIIVTMTGGLQEQVTDGENWFGVGIEPASKAIIGSQDIPYIYEDRVAGEDVVSSLEKLYNMSEEEREELGKKGRAHVLKNYNFENFCQTWENTLTTIHQEAGSWDDRRGYNTWEMKEL